MVETFGDYIDKYLVEPEKEDRRCPGEHHFVSAYLVPRLFEIYPDRVPDYINPDGTKEVTGDVVYYRDKKHQFGIEVKLGTIRLTTGEFNKWIVSTAESGWPHTFIGIGTAGIGICSWGSFRETYIGSVRTKQRKRWHSRKLKEGYGPMKSANLLMAELGTGQFFEKPKTTKDYGKSEKDFIGALKREVTLDGDLGK